MYDARKVKLDRKIHTEIHMKMKKICLILALSTTPMLAMPAFASVAASGNGGSTSYGSHSESESTSVTAAEARKAKKSNSAECKNKTEANQREHDDNIEKEDADAQHQYLSHDSHASAHKANTHHDEMVSNDRNAESIHENERKLLCGDIDDGKDISNEQDDRDRQAQHDRENSDAETQQNR